MLRINHWLGAGCGLAATALIALPAIGQSTHSSQSGSDAHYRAQYQDVDRYTNRSGATLTFTRITNGDGRYSYNGRMLSMKHIDALNIVQEQGKFALVKKEFSDLLME